MKPKRYSEDSVLRAATIACGTGSLVSCERRDDTTKPTWTVQLFGDGTYLDVNLDELAGIVMGIAAQRHLDERSHRVDVRDFVGYEDDSACSGGFGVRVFAQDGAHSKLLYGGREVECARISDAIADMLVTWPGWYDSSKIAQQLEADLVAHSTSYRVEQHTGGRAVFVCRGCELPVGRPSLKLHAENCERLQQKLAGSDS